MEKRRAPSDITAERVLAEYARIAFARLDDVAELAGGVRLRQDLGPDGLAAVASVKCRPGGGECEIKMYDKLKALEVLGRHVGLFDGGPGGAAPLPRIVSRPDGSASLEEGGGDDEALVG